MADEQLRDAAHDTVVEVLNFLEQAMRGPMTYAQVEALIEGEFADLLVPAVADLDSTQA